MIKPIRSTADLTQAKAQLGEMLKSNRDGDHDDEIAILSTLIEQFEQTNVSIDAPSPIAAIKFRMEQLGLTARQLEPYIGSRARVSEVLSGKRQLSIDMIRSLHEGLHIPYVSLISQSSERARPTRVSSPTAERFNALGLFADREEMSDFVRVVTDSIPASAMHRRTRTQRAASKTDQNALLLWQAAVLKRSETPALLNTFDRSRFNAATLRNIARLSRKSDGPTKAIRTLAESGISIVVLPPLPGTFLDGAVMTGRAGNPVIGLTLRYDRSDSFWFTLLHELAHVVLHYDQLLDHRAAFIDDMEIKSTDESEREADDLASESLIPQAMLSKVQWNETTTQDEIIKLSVLARVHVAIVAGRWQRDHQNYKKFARLIERGTVRAQIVKNVHILDIPKFD